VLAHISHSPVGTPLLSIASIITAGQDVRPLVLNVRNPVTAPAVVIVPLPVVVLVSATRM